MAAGGESGQPAGGLRASDADRDQAIETLTVATAEGRLTLEEYSQRSGAALAARTIGDLTALTDDLPVPGPAAPGPAAAVPGGGAVEPAAGGAVEPVPAEITAVLGNESRKGPWVVPPRLTVRSVLGDCHLEMQDAVIRQRVTTIDATAKFGSITIFVPDGLDVRMSGRAILGAKSSDLHGEPRPGAPVIIVHCDVLCGAITVRRPGFLMRRARQPPAP